MRKISVEIEVPEFCWKPKTMLACKYLSDKCIVFNKRLKRDLSNYNIYPCKACKEAEVK